MLKRRKPTHKRSTNKSSMSQSKSPNKAINIAEHTQEVYKKAVNVDQHYLDILSSQEKMYDDMLQIISERQNKIISQENRRRIETCSFLTHFPTF